MPVRTEVSSEDVRLSMLCDILAGAKRSVDAVIFEHDDHFFELWGTPTAARYIHTNVAAAARGVAVDILLVVSSQSLSGSNQRTNIILRQVIDALQMQVQPSTIAHVISLDRLTSMQQSWNTSLFVCDDTVASESAGLKHGALVAPYVSFDEPTVISDLKERFAGLRFCAELPAGW